MFVLVPTLGPASCPHDILQGAGGDHPPGCFPDRELDLALGPKPSDRRQGAGHCQSLYLIRCRAERTRFVSLSCPGRSSRSRWASTWSLRHQHRQFWGLVGRGAFHANFLALENLTKSTYASTSAFGFNQALHRLVCIGRAAAQVPRPHGDSRLFYNRRRDALKISVGFKTRCGSAPRGWIRAPTAGQRRECRQ